MDLRTGFAHVFKTMDLRTVLNTPENIPISIEIALVSERVDCRFLVSAGSEFTITEITEYTYFSPFKPCATNLHIKVTKIFDQWILFCFSP